MPDEIRVLYMDGVGPFGGASRSLFEAVRLLAADSISPYFIATAGTSVSVYRDIALDLIETRGLTRFDNTLYSHYRGRRWAVLLREIYLLPFSFHAIRKAFKKWHDRIDLIHANEVLEIFPAIYAKYVWRKPLVVHVRSVQRAQMRSWRYRLIVNLLRHHASAVVAIDETVRRSLPADLRVDVIHNSFTPKNAAVPDATIISAINSLPKSALKVGFVGNLHHSKGLFEMVEAAKILAGQGREVEFVIVGGTTMSDVGKQAALLRKTGLAQNVESQLRQRAKELGVDSHFHILGATKDIKSVYDNIDVLCFPSHYDAPGRPVFEAAFSATPSIVAVNDPKPDTLIPGETGLAIPMKDVAALAKAIAHFHDNRNEVSRMGAAALTLAEKNFDPARNAAKLVAVYRRLTAIN